MALIPGTRLGPYEIVARIGEGGMGDVYKATDTRLGRTVAVKVARAEFSARFEREARAVAALNHPHICQLYDVGPNYLVMELVDGAPIAPPGDAARLVELAAEIADALVAAHDAGIVRRDLKPDNILVTKDGRVKVLDFGLATGAFAAGSADALATQAATAVGTAVGTVAYMSPEQARGETVNARSDLWSLGVVLFELATGERPFGGATAAVVFDNILNQPVSLSTADAHISYGLSQLLLKLLEKNPEQRYQSAVELRTDLRRLIQPSSGPARDSSHRPSIAVLPFTNMSNDPEQEYFSDGVVEDIITALSRFRQLFVIARNSTFTYKGRAVDVRQVAEELGVRYVLEGSVRRAGERIRITGQLIDGSTGAHLWADRFDGRVEDLFDLQDKVAANVVGIIEPAIRKAEIERSRRKRPDSLDAYELYLRALPHLYAFRPDDNVKALELLHRAIDLDPNFALALGHLAWGYEQRLARQWPATSDTDPEMAASLARRAIEADSDDARVLSLAAFVLMIARHDHDTAVACARRSLELNASDAQVFESCGWIYCFAGDAEASRRCVERALELNPIDPMKFSVLTNLGMVNLFQGRYEEARVAAEEAIAINPDWDAHYCVLAAANVNLDRFDKANKAIAELRVAHPDITLSLVRDG